MACLNVPDTSITIGNETFSIVEIPQAGTTLVEEVKKSLLGELDFESLEADFSKLEMFIRIACNGTAGNKELQIKLRVANKMTILIKRMADILQEIPETTSSDLKKLQNVFQLLFHGREIMAIETLKLLSIDARIMAVKAEELRKGFDNTTTYVISALEDTQRTKGAREDHKRDLERWRKFDDVGLEEVAIDALHNSVGALKSLSTIMMNAALFWRQMQAHCESLTNEDMQKMIERAMKYPEEKRLKIWTSRGFKVKVIIYCSKWVALKDLCGTYKNHIIQIHQNLYGCLQENPTVDEAMKNVRELVTAFSNVLNKYS